MNPEGNRNGPTPSGFGETDYRPLVRRCETAYDIFRLLRSISAAFGYSHFQTIDLPLTSPFSLSALSVVSNWPPELVNAYDANRLLEDSAVIQTLMQSTEPIVWQIEKINENRTRERRALAVELFREFGLINGVYFSVHTAQRTRGAVSFAGNRPDPSTGELMELSFLSSLIYERLKSFALATTAVEKALSPREKQCLQWTAAGKTSLEIALILELSEHTVNHYLSTVCQKLDAHNRAHMVSKAMRMGLLH
jgi:LuxR family transcriptional regulator, quorum-sensing system regulator BjaR1